MSKSQALIGQRIGNLQIVEKIGKGGVGHVYRAEHISLGTPYAVKVLGSRFSKDTTVMERFRREAIACARLRHPNVVFVTDFGLKPELGIYIIMEFLEGRSLTAVLEDEAPMELERAGRIGLQICDALEAAHQMGIVHRDLKPDNIHVRSVVGQPILVKVLDFGIALLTGQSSLTEAGTTVGSPHYMSPEQVQGFADKIGPCSDVYALGVLLYQMLTGTWPLWSDDLFTLCKMQVMEVPAPIGAHRPSLAGSRLESLVASMLAKDTKARPASMDAVARELVESMKEQQVTLMPSLHDQGDNDFGPTQATDISTEQFRVLHTLQSLAKYIEGTPAEELLDAMPGMSQLPEALFRTALLGPISAELASRPIDGERFEKARQQLAILTQGALARANEAGNRRFLLALGTLLRGLARQRQEQVCAVLEDALKHPAFPQDAMPDWAQVRTTGTWKKVEAEDIAQDEAQHEPFSLMDKLRQPVSLQSFRAVLTHNLTNRNNKGSKH